MTAYWERTLDNYDSGTWTATYKLHASGLTSITIATTGSGTTHTVDAKPATTTTWAAGDYQWILLVSDGTDTFEVDQGVIEIIAETATGSALLDAQAYLDAAEVELDARATGKPTAYSIKDRSLTRATVDELQRIVKYWSQKVNALKKAERRRKGGKAHNIINAKF